MRAGGRPQAAYHPRLARISFSGIAPISRPFIAVPVPRDIPKEPPQTAERRVTLHETEKNSVIYEG